MKKICITGSAKLQPEVMKWKKYWEDSGDIVLDYPKGLNPNNYVEEYAVVHPEFNRQLEQADIQFVMNEDKNGISGYIGYASFAEMNYAVIRKTVHHQDIKIILLKMPDDSISASEEIKLWLKLGWIEMFKNSNDAQ